MNQDIRRIIKGILSLGEYQRLKEGRPLCMQISLAQLCEAADESGIPVDELGKMMW